MNSLWTIPICYIIGLFPSAYIAGRLVKRVDIKLIGDHNPGSANVSRNIHRLAGIAVLIVDLGKGFLAIILAKHFAPMPIVFICGIAVVAGHDWPIIFKFRGGRGLATTIGIFYALISLPTLYVTPLGLFMLWKTRHLVVSSLVTLPPLFILAWLLHYSLDVILYCLGLVCFAGIMHFITTRNLNTKQKSESIRWG